MLRSILPHPTSDFRLLSSNEGGSEGGDGGSGGGAPAGTTEPAKTEPTGVPQDKVDSIVKERVNETKRSTEERIAKDLGVSLDEAKRLITAAKAKEDSEKSEAQLAREKADAERAAAETEKGQSAQAKHEAKVERHILRNLSLVDEAGKPLEDDVIDKKVSRIARLVDAETGADDDTIKAAVKSLKDEEPLLFGQQSDGGSGNNGGTPPASGDPKGTPPTKPGAEGAYERGRKRAKEHSGGGEYPILAGSAPDNVT